MLAVRQQSSLLCRSSSNDSENSSASTTTGTSDCDDERTGSEPQRSECSLRSRKVVGTANGPNRVALFWRWKLANEAAKRRATKTNSIDANWNGRTGMARQKYYSFNGTGPMATTSSSTTPHRRRDSSPIGTAITAFFADPARRSLNSVLGNSAKERVASNSFSVPSTSGLNQTRGSSSQSQEHLSRQQLSAPYSQSGNAEGESVVEGLAYLGCSKMDDPTSEAEMLGIIATLNAEKAHDAVSVTLVIPGTQTGIIRLLESGATASSAAAEGLAEICSFPIQRIRFCARGKPNSAERGCFALSFTQLAGKNAALHQCHVFRCKLPEETARALFCFAQAFHRQNLQRVKLPLANGECDPSEELYEFEALLEIKEKDTRRDQEQGFSICPVERNCFKMRRDREKRVVVMLRQTAGPRHLKVTKCFGLLLAAGRNLRQSDMHLLDMHSASEGQQNPHVFVVEARWYPSAQNFEVLNTETPRETRVFMTIAVDVTLDGLNEAIRFNVECKARIFQQFERFWSAPHLAMSERYSLLVQKAPMDEQASTSSVDSGVYVSSSQSTEQPTDKNARKLIRFESATERQRCAQATKDKSPNRMMPTQLIHPADDDESDSDEPLLSGSGAVSRECSEDRLCEWKTVVEQWKQEPDKRPPGLNSLIYDGCPDVLRGEVWPLLARVDPDTSDLIQTYRMLLEKECPQDAVILRDIHRTFPAHDHFKESNELGQKSLYRISKAYSLYDEEVGYCQGLSFLAAALLLHMPEERAFCVLVRIMFDYGLRELFKTGFDALHLRFHQLQRLMEDYTHELYAHFQELGVETHMYASQWFLTLFTAKFPLQMVFFIVDLFLTEGINTIFHISLALLQDSKKELLQSDFEGVLKFFRVNLPRKYRTETNAKELIHAAVKLKISHKRLAKYEKEWHELKRRELESQDPLERLERENCRLKEQILRLERENDDLAHELVTSKIELRNKLDTTEDQLETTVSQLVRKSREVEEMGERECQLREESDQVKQRCRQEVKRLEEELRRAANVNAEYKRICSDLGTAADEDKRKWEEHRKIVAARVSGCERCSEALGDWDADSPRSRSQNGTAEEQNGEGKGECAKLNGASALHVMELVERLEEREQHIRQVELELAQTKLALVESQCQNQDLTHQMTTSMMLAQNCSNASNGGDHHHYSTSDSRPAWLKKTLSSLKEAHQAFGNSTSGHHRSSSNASMASMSVDSGR